MQENFQGNFWENLEKIVRKYQIILDKNCGETPALKLNLTLILNETKSLKLIKNIDSKDEILQQPCVTVR